MDQLVALDMSWFHDVNMWAGHWAWLDLFMVLMTKFGVVLLIAYAVLLCFRGKTPEKLYQNRVTAIVAVLAAVLALLMNEVIGHFIFRNRPFIDCTVNLLVYHDATNSFPSNHAAGSLAMAMVIYFRRYWGGRFVMAIALLICFSRVFVGVHYPLDVVVGIVVGIVSASIMMEVASRQINMIWQNLKNRIE